MRLEELTEGKFEYGVGDTVNTPFGAGEIVDEVKKTEKDHYYMVSVDATGRKKFDLEDKPIKMGSFEFKGIIKKGNK